MILGVSYSPQKSPKPTKIIPLTDSVCEDEA